MGKHLRILLVDDDEEEFILTRDLLADRSYGSRDTKQIRFDLEWVGTYEAGLEAITEERHDVYLVDYHLGDRNGLELLREVTARGCRSPIILMTGRGSYSIDVEAMKAGATDYLPKTEITAALLERTIRYAIERKRAEEDIRKNASRAELLATLSHAFAEASLNYPEVLNIIATQVANSTGDACVIRLLSDDGSWLDPVAFYHPDEDTLSMIRDGLVSSRHPANAGLAGHVLGTGKPLLIVDIQKNADKYGLKQDLKDWLGKIPVQSLLAVPLRAEGRLIGTLGLLRLHSKNPFTPDDQIFFQDLADRAALAIEIARLYLAEANRVRELDALQTATAALLRTIDLEILLSHILDVAQSAIPAAEKGLLHLIAPDTGMLHVRATSGFSDPRIHKDDRTKSKDFPPVAVHEKRPLLIRDVLVDSRFSESIPADTIAVRSFISAPLVLEENLLGALSLSSSRPLAFTEADLRLLVSFATTTTAAIKNAILHAEVQKLAITDSLTDIYNRRGFFELGQREVERAYRFSRPLSAIMLDVDNLKEINDKYSHAVGDQALRILVERLRTSTREVDILGRYGGDEFVVLLPETDLATASVVAERIRTRIAEPMMLSGSGAEHINLTITASLGIVHSGADMNDLASLLRRADAAAYRAKQNGRNRIEFE